MARKKHGKKKTKKTETSASETTTDTKPHCKQQKNDGRNGNHKPPKGGRNGNHKPSATDATPPFESNQLTKVIREGKEAAIAVEAPVSNEVSKDPNPEVLPSRPVASSSRVRSSSECRTASSQPRDNSELKKVNISVDNDPIGIRRRIPIDYFIRARNNAKVAPGETTDRKIQPKETREPPVTAFPKPRRPMPSKADKDMNWRAPRAPCNHVPAGVKELLLPGQAPGVPAKEKDETETFVEFTGGENLQLTIDKCSVDVFFGEADLQDDDKRNLSWTMEGLTSMISPIWREKNVVVSMDEIFEAAVTCAQSMEESDRTAVIAEKGTSLVKETLLWLRRLFFVRCCGAGFIAQDFIEDQIPEFQEVSKLDHKSELEFMLQFADRISKSVIVPDCKELLKTVNDFREVMELVEKEDVDELAKKNLHFALSNPVERLRFDRPISDDELFEIVDSSVTTDCGKYLWIVDRCPEKLKGSSKIVASIIKGISLRRVSKDQRPARAYYMLMPQLLASLSEEELHSLAEEHVENRERKVENWPEMMYEGFLMCLPNIQSKPRDTTDIVLLQLLQAKAADEMKFFLMACALIAEFNPALCRRIYDFSTDSFCTRLARVFMSDQISPEKRSLLLKALMSLPEPFKDRLLAREDFNPELSLYHSVKAICTEMPKVPTTEIRSLGLLVIRELATVLSPARMISFAIIPCLSHGSARFRAACLLPALLACEKLSGELLDEKGVLTPADLVKIALEQYEEPQGTTPKARYGFIENILKTVDVVLEEDVPQTIIDEINIAFKEKELTWQQHYALVHITFPKSNTKLNVPQVPPVDFSLEGLVSLNATAVLQTWPNQEEVRSVFEKAFSGVLAKADKVLVAYILLSAANAPDSQIKDHTEFLLEFVKKTVDDIVECEERKNGEPEAETVAKDSVKTEKDGENKIEDIIKRDVDKKDEEVVGEPHESENEVDREEKEVGSDDATEKFNCNEKNGVSKELESEDTEVECVSKVVENSDGGKKKEEKYDVVEIKKDIDLKLAGEKENEDVQGEKAEKDFKHSVMDQKYGCEMETEVLKKVDQTKDVANKKSQDGLGDEKEEEHITWLTKKLLEASDADPEVRRLVLLFAADSPNYSREAERIQDAIATVECAPKKADHEQPAVKKENEEDILPKNPEEKLVPIQHALAVSDLSFVVPVASEVLPKTSPLLVSPSPSYISTVHDDHFIHGIPFPPPRISPIVDGFDTHGVSCPPHFQCSNEEELSRWILWFRQDVATACGDFVGFLKSREFRDHIFLPREVRMSVGGRRPDIRNNWKRPPLPNHEMSLHLELSTAAHEGHETLLGRVVDTINVALSDYMTRFPELHFSPQQMNTVFGQLRLSPNVVRATPPSPPFRGTLEFRRSNGPSNDFSGGRGRGGQPSFRGGRGSHRQQPRPQREEQVHRRYENEQPAHSLSLNGVSYKVFEEKFGDNVQFHNLQKSLRCQIRTINRKKVSCGDHSEPLIVRIQGDQEDLDNAVRHIKEMFGLE